MSSARSGASGLASQITQVVPDVGVDAGAVAAQQRLAEPGEHHPAGEVGDHGEPQLGGGDQPLEGQAGGLTQGFTRWRIPQPGPEQRRDGHGVSGGPLLGQENPEHRGFELG